MSNYIALLRKDADSDYGVDFPDFPGCITVASTLDEAKDRAGETLQFHIDGMIEDGDALPAPSDLSTVMADRHNKDAVAFLVSVSDIKDKAVRVNVTFRESVLRRIDAAAKKHGTTRSGYLQDAALKEMDSA